MTNLAINRLDLEVLKRSKNFVGFCGLFIISFSKFCNSTFQKEVRVVKFVIGMKNTFVSTTLESTSLPRTVERGRGT